MKLKIILAVGIALIFSLAIAIPVFATALYTGTLDVTNNSTAATNVGTVFTLNSQSLIDNAMCASDISDVNITYNGVPQYFMPGWIGNPWCVYVPTIGTTTINYILQTKGATGGLIRYFPGTTGMTVTDTMTEPATNYSMNMTTVYLDTSNATGKYVYYKPNALEVFVSPTTSGTILYNLYSTTYSDNFSSDTWTDVGTQINVNTGNSRIEYVNLDTAAVDQRTYKDIGVVSDTAWNWNFKSNVTARTATSFLIFSLGSVSANYQGYAGDDIGLIISGTATPTYGLYYHDGGGAAVFSGSVTTALNTDYYIRVQRLTSISARLNVYSDAARTVHVAGSPVNFVIPATVTTLRYLQAGNYANGAAGNAITGSIDTLDFYNLGAQTSLSGITTGEKATFLTGYTTPFMYMSTDTYTPPYTTGLTLNASFGQTECNAPSFPGIDSVGNTLTLGGTPIWTTSGYDFERDDAGDYISIGTEPGALTSLTIEAWVNYETSGIDRAVWHTSATNDDRAISMRSNGIGIETDGVPGLQEIFHSWTFGSIPTGWHHLVLSWDGTNLRGYYDGVLDGSPVAATGTLNAVGQDSTIGGYVAGGWWMDGFIGELRFSSNTALTAAQVLQNYNATKITYDGTTNKVIHSWAGTINNSTDSYTLCPNPAVMYVDKMYYYQSGVFVDMWTWVYGLTCTGSVTGNIGTFSFRTTSSDADVSAELVSFTPTDTSELGSFSFTGDLPDIGVPDTPTQMYPEGDYTHIPVADSVNEMLGEGGVPYSLWWYPFIYFLIGIVGLMTYGATQGPMAQRSTNNPFDGSLLIMAVVMEVLIVVAGILNPVPLWPAYLFPIPALAIISSRKHQSLG